MMNKSQRKTITIGITGGIACGKSEVGKLFAKAGFAVCDADDIAHDIMQPGSSVFDAVVQTFGRSILNTDGAIDRYILGKIVFSDDQARDTLNNIVHPAVRRKWRTWLKESRKIGQSAAVIIPLLYEVGETELWDAVVCVSSDKQSTIARLKERGLNAGEAEQRIAAQMPLEQKETMADYIIRNDGTLNHLRDITEYLIKSINTRFQYKNSRQKGQDHD